MPIAPMTPRTRAYLDGEYVPNATVVCSGGTGWVLIPKRNARGETLLDPETGQVAMECRFGRVEVREVA